MAWKASNGSGTDPAAREGHFEKAASGANNSDKAGGRERLERRDAFAGNKSSMLALSPSDMDLEERMCLRPGGSRSWTKVTGLHLAEINGLTALSKQERQREKEWTKTIIPERIPEERSGAKVKYSSFDSDQSGSKAVTMVRLTIPEQPERFLMTRDR